jgi:peptide/nickel transport system ATP-binding protein/oligopeptide transport system ATP-binding protein
VSAPAPAPAPLLEARGLAREFVVKRGWFAPPAVIRAVDGVDLTIARGEALGLVGESGSGKSTVARLLLRLIEPTAGTVRLDGTDVLALDPAALRRARRSMQMIFQNPHGALNPRRTVFASIAEPLVIQDGLGGSALEARVAGLMEVVSLPPLFLWRFPHELSGGQKQRVCIARALALEPRLVVLDEPTSALDVSVQAQILEFLRALKARLDLTYLFISHNLAVVRYLCERVAVMYLGRIVEEGPTAEVFADPRHPYTRALLAAVPQPRADAAPPQTIGGDVPSAAALPAGCRFAPRCPLRIPGRCDREDPPLRRDGARAVACHLWPAA